MSRKNPDTWMEIITKAFPSDTLSTLRFGTHAMAFPTFIQGRGISWSSFRLALSDWKGNDETAVISAEINDVDAVLRAITDAIGVSAYAKAEVSLNLLSKNGRRAPLTPRKIFRGFLTKSPTADSNRKSSIEAANAVGSKEFGLDPSEPLVKAVIDKAFLEASGLVNTPKDNIGRIFPWYVGEHSTQGWTDVNGDSASIGMKPVYDLGDVVLTSSYTVDTTVTHRTEVPPPEIYDYGVIGTPGSKTRYYSVNGLFPDGRTRASATVQINNTPDVLDASNYVFIKFRPPAGWEDYYRNPNTVPTPFSFPSVEVNGRSNNPANRRLDVGGFLTGGGDIDEYHDDQDQDIEKLPGPPAVGEVYVITTEPGDPSTITDSQSYGVMMVNLGYNEIHKIFGADFTDNSLAKREVLPVDHPDIVWPGGSTWPHPNPWLEWGVTGDEIRWSGFFVKGNLLKHMRNGDVTFAVDGCGITDTGDEAGVPITEASEGYIATIDLLALKGYRKGNFWPSGLDTFIDGTTILDTDVIRAFQEQTVGFIGDRGYQMHLAITDQTTLSEFHKWFNTTFFTFTGPTDSGQCGVWTMPDLATDLSTTRIYRHKIEIPGRLPVNDEREDEVENYILAKYDYNPDSGQFIGEPETFEDTNSQRIYGKRPAAAEGSFVECRATRDRSTFLSSMGRRLYYNKVAPNYQSIPVGLIGFEQPMGSVIRVQHPDLLVETVVPMFLISKEINPNPPNQRVTMLARDLGRNFADHEIGGGTGPTGHGMPLTMPFVMGV